MSAIWSIATNTMREARRNRIFYSIFFFALIVILNSFVFRHLTVGTQDRVLRDVGTTALDFFGVLLAIFLGIGMVSREVERRTIYTVVTKPIRRADFILGKFFGLNGILIVTLGVMFACLLVVLSVMPHFDPLNMATLTWYLVLRLVELAVLVAFAILLSTFSTPALSAFLTIGLYVVGHFTKDLKYFGGQSESPAVRAMADGLYYALPNLSRFSISEQIAYNLPVDSMHAALSVAYGLGYAAAFVTAAVLVFERRDFR